MREKVQAALSKMKPGLGGTVIELVDVKEKEGIVKIRVFVPSCGVAMSEEMALDVLQELLEDEAPEIKKVITVK
jgi:Fe-S cluster biogenesis protein NfuA